MRGWWFRVQGQGSKLKANKTSGGGRTPVRHTIPLGIVIFPVCKYFTTLNFNVGGARAERCTLFHFSKILWHKKTPQESLTSIYCSYIGLVLLFYCLVVGISCIYLIRLKSITPAADIDLTNSLLVISCCDKVLYIYWWLIGVEQFKFTIWSLPQSDNLYILWPRKWKLIFKFLSE